jgi:hypothetical protein
MTLSEAWFLFRLWRKAMKLRKILNGIQWLNVLSMAAQMAAALSGVFPASVPILATNAVLGVLLPSLGGVSHKVDGTVVVPK